MKRYDKIAVVMLLLFVGCQPIARGPELERARAAVAVAVAQAAIVTQVWDGELPLEPPAVESEPATSGAADEEAKPEQGKVEWTVDLLTAVKNARKSDKMVWGHIVSDQCSQCVRLENTTFRDADFTDYANERSVPVKINRRRGIGPAAVEAFALDTNDPVDVFVFPDGKLLSFEGAPADTAAFIERFRGAEKYRHKARWCNYPVDGQTPWKLGGRRIGVNHLLNHSNHRNKFNRAWLESLTDAEIQELHADDHESTPRKSVVRWEFVPPAN